MTIFGIYVVLGYTFWGGMIALALCAALRVKGFTCRNIEIPFFFLFLLALVFFRWTLLTTNKEYHADESFFIAEGMKYLTDFLPWRSVDGTTSGPFDSWFIMWPLLVGLPMNYCTARVTGVVIIFLTVFFTQRLLRHVLDPEWSLVLILPLATMYCFLWERAFASYTSQDLSVALLAALAWVGFVSAKNPTPLRAFIIGLITGAIPFGKLQAAPAAAVITSSIFVAWILAAYRGALPRRKIGIVLLVAIGSIFLIPAAILIPVAAGGAFHDFWIRYPWASMANGAPRASGWIASTEMLREGQADNILFSCFGSAEMSFLV